MALFQGGLPRQGVRRKDSCILKEAGARAEEWDKTVSLDNIKQCACDEIFQNGKPVFAVVDTASTYVAVLEEQPDRKGSTWQATMEEAGSRGLDPDNIVSDQGTGIIKGTANAFPGADWQPDVFHKEMEFQKLLSKAEARAYSLIKAEYDLESKAGASGRKKTAAELSTAREKSARHIACFDEICILFGWLKELPGYSGYSPKESADLASWVADGICEAAERAGMYDILAAARGIKQELPDLLGFVGRLFKKMGDKAGAMRIPEDAFHLLYHLKTHAKGSKESSFIKKRISKLLGSKKDVALQALEEIIRTAPRASSPVENANSRIRPHMDLKRKR